MVLFFLCLRMAFFINGLQLLIDHMCVELSRRNIAMTHELLQRTKIRTVFQKVYCKAVPQRMGRDFFIDMCSSLVMLQQLPKALTAHSATGHINK